MSNFALIQDGFVVNAAVWDGKGDIFSEFTTLEITNDFPAAIGDAFFQEKLYPKPRDGYEYDFDTKKLKWIITAGSAIKQSENNANSNLMIAQSEYTRASENITSLQQRIEDEDYDLENTEISVSADKIVWTSYRKSLRAYIAAADGTKRLPSVSDA